MAKGKYQQWLEPENLLRITNWAANGLTNKEIAQSMSVAMSTFCAWAEKYPEFSEALKRGRAMSCQAVENALFRRATGYDYEDTDVTEEYKGEMRDGKPTNGQITRREVKHARHVPPDVGAVIFYLKNRMPDRYSDRRVVEQAQAAPQVILGIEPARAG